MKPGTIPAITATSLALSALLVPPNLAAADETPLLRQGLWHYHRVMGAQSLDSEKCTDPVQSWKAPKAGMEKSGCTQSLVNKAGNSYTFTTTCPAMNVVSKSVMTIEGDSAYTVDITSTMGGKTSNETLTAKRVGDCKGS
jgi:hypothetical protein